VSVHQINQATDQVPADISALTAGSMVVLMVDPATADQIAAALELAAHMAAAGVEARPRWEQEAAAITAAADLARHEEGLQRLDAAIPTLGLTALPDGVVPLRPVTASPHSPAG
jgi:hypothetical protein